MRAGSSLLLVAALSAVVVASAFGGETAVARAKITKLGPLAELSALRFRGQKTLDEAALRRAVDCDLAVAAACDPDAPLGPYLAAVEARVATEHRHVGYHDAKVKASVNEQDRRIDVVVEPGRRYRCGRVIVTGNKLVPTADLQRWLTQPIPNDNDGIRHDPDVGLEEPVQWIRSDYHEPDFLPALWPTGEFASFKTSTLSTLNFHIRDVYFECGRHEPRLEVRYQFHDDTVDLIVDMRDEGRPLIIEEIAVGGNQRSATRDILDLIDIKVGQTFDRRVRSRIERMLWHSARFQYSGLTFQPAVAADANFASTKAAAGKDDAKSKSSDAKADDKKSDDAEKKSSTSLIDVVPRKPSRLTISVVEAVGVPSLHEKLSPEQTALLKFRDWMLKSAARGDEYEFRVVGADDWSMEVIVDPRRGWLLDWSYHSKKLGGIRRSYGIRSTTEGFGLYAFDQGKKIEFAADGSQLHLLTNYYLRDDPEEPVNFHYDFGAHRPVAGHKLAPLAVKHRISPATIVAFAPTVEGVKNQVHCKIVDGVLQIDGENARIKVEAATGKYLGLSYLGFDRNELELGSGARLECRVVRGALAAREKTWLEKTKTLRNEVDEANRIPSLLKFIFSDPCWDDMHDKKGKLRPWLRIFRRAVEADLAEFYFAAKPMWEANAAGAAAVDQADLPLCVADACFPRGSWPWVQTRQFTLESSGSPSFAQQALSRAADDGGWGPLAYRCAAAMGAKFNYRYLTPTWSARAAAPTDAASRARDWKPLLAETHLSGRFLSATAKFARSLDDADAELVYRTFLADVPQCTACLRAVRAEPKRPLEEILSESVAKAWTPDAEAWATKWLLRATANR